MSSGSDSDEEFIPGEPEQLSEEDSADDETDLQYEVEQEEKTKKRKVIQDDKHKKKSKRFKNNDNTIVQENLKQENKLENAVDPEEEKKREEELWSKFLEGTDTIPKADHSTSDTIANKVKCSSDILSNKKAECVMNNEKSDADDVKAKEKRIFEFAGEKIVVENNVIKEKIPVTQSPAAKISTPIPTRSAGGLSSLVGSLNKKSKLSTLEKTKLDWNTYKKVEGIEEEVQNHNKGKDGYLDRQDFLQRTDLRQYEIERDLRLKRRSNR